MRLLVATNNAGKMTEYRYLLQDLSVELVSPTEANLALDVDESGDTFAANARLKAEAFAAASGLPTLADDSGLEVDALGGEPGVRSARYGGPRGTDVTRYRLLLERLRDVPWERRGARFRCVIALAAPSPIRERVWLADGRCEGFIARASRGTHGFGYDPVFFVPEFGLTLAELPDETKNLISHRARAVRGAKALLVRHFLAGQIGPAQLPPPVPALSEVRIRSLQAADFAPLARCCQLAKEELDEALAQATEGGPSPLIAELDADVVGYAELRVRGSRAEIGRLAVSSSSAVPGIDRALVHVLAEVARERGLALA